MLPRVVLEALEASWGAPWDAQEGAKLEQKRSLEAVCLKLERHSYIIEFWTPRGEVDGLGEAPSGDTGILHCGVKNAIFPLVFTVFAKSRLCARNEEFT